MNMNQINKLKFPNPEAYATSQEFYANVRARIDWEKTCIGMSSVDNHNDKLVEDIEAKLDLVEIELHPDKRTRQDLIRLIAALEYIAGQYEDEISDGQYISNF